MTALFQRRFPATDSSGSVEDNLFNAGVQPVVGSGRLETPDDPFIFGVLNAFNRHFRCSGGPDAFPGRRTHAFHDR